MKYVKSTFKNGKVNSSFFVHSNIYVGDYTPKQLAQKSTQLPVVEDKHLGERLFSGTNINYGILPPAVRWISKDGSIVVFERPPLQHMMSYISKPKGSITGKEKEEQYILPLPWTVYIVRFTEDYTPYKIFVYTRPEQITSMDDRLYLLPVPNFYGNGELCNPISGEIEVPNANLSGGINAAFNRVWNSGFNRDLMDAAHYGLRAEFPVKWCKFYDNTVHRDEYTAYFDGWSKLNVLDVLDAKFPDPRVTNKVEDTVQIGNGVWTVRSVVDAVEKFCYQHDEFLVKYINTISAL